MGKATALIERMRPLMEQSGEGFVVKCDYATGQMIVRGEDNNDYEVSAEVAKGLADEKRPLQTKKVKFSTSNVDGKEMVTSISVVEE